jgi:pilus assembly protein CpaB
MMFKRSTSLILVAALLAGGAAWIANKWALNRNQVELGLSANESSVVVASMDIPYGQTVEEQHVKLIRISKKAVPDGAFNHTEDIVGKVANENAMRGDILRASRFVEHFEGSTLASLIAKEKRAITVRVNDVIGVGGFLLPGNRVDVRSTKK